MRALMTQLLPDGRREKALVTDQPEPGEPSGNEIKTKTLYSGVTNGTERNDLLGGNYATPDDELPSGWGYQNVGEVVAVGPEVRHVKVGDRVFSSSDHVEWVVTPEDELVVVLPEAVEPRQAALFGMASVATRTCRHADLRLGERVLVVGAGCVGQFAAQVAAAMGARVDIADLDAARLETATRIGAVERALNVASAWDAMIEPGTYDAVLDMAGVPGMEDQLIAAVRERGRVLLIAGRSQVSYDFNAAQDQEITIKQNSHFDQSDLEELCRLVARGAVQIEPLIQDTVPVADAAEVYVTLRDRPGELLGTVFVW
jgi:2-desacetyl-2-hydroxyethyl bacteriochlorophyllide A dehydrogenase